MIEVKNEVETGVEVVVQPRINILYMVIYELADQFGAGYRCLETIKKGVLEKQYLRKITLGYYNRNNEIVGEIYFEIDWEKYQINAAGDKGATFKINCKKSTYSQISEMGDEIVKYVNKMKRDLEVVKIESWYNTIRCKPEDAVQKKEIDEYLGLCSREEKDIYNISPEFQHNFEFIFNLIDELTIGISRI